MDFPFRVTVRRSLVVLLVVLLVNAGLLVIVSASEGPGVAPQDTFRVFLPLNMKQAAIPPPGDTVLIPAGTFQMGCAQGGPRCDPNELPLHTVHLDSYRIDRTEVTNGQYQQCVLAGSCTPPRNNSSYTRLSYYGNPAGASFPVIQVSWYQADAYCRWRGGTIAERS